MSSESPVEATDSVLRMKFEGGRFDTNEFPASVLTEVSRLNRLFVLLAEEFWREDHPNRLRVPKGFSKRFELFLSGINPGSVKPIFANSAIATERSTPLDLPGGVRSDEELASAAANAVTDAFISIVRSGSLPDWFPMKAKRETGRIFSSLDKSEYPTFWDDSGETYKYTHSLRMNFVESLAPGTRIGSGQVAGRIAGIDADGDLSSLRLADGSKIAVSYMPDLFEDFREAVAQRTDSKFVVLKGTSLIVADRIEELISVEELSAIVLPEGKIGARFLELLSDDLDGEVAAVAPELAELAIELLQVEGVPSEPAIFPLADGGIQMVWRKNGSRATVNIQDVNLISANTFYLRDREANREWEWMDLSEAKAQIRGVINV